MSVLTAETTGVKGGSLRDLSDQLRQQHKVAAVLLGSVDDGRAFLVFNLDPTLNERGLDAGALVRAAASHIGGGGGGKPTLGEAGGAKPHGLSAALEAGRKAIEAALA